MNFLKKHKIAITSKDSSKLWSNGLTQNAYFLICLLSAAGYDVDAVSQFDDVGKQIEEFEIKKLTAENIKNYNIVIEVCYSVTDQLLFVAKKNGVKIVTINYGNSLMLMQEDMLLRPEQTPAINRGGYDTWISPHFEFSKGFVETTSKGNVSICPYIWDPKIFDKYCAQTNLNPFYEHGDLKKIKIGIFESNINIIKTAIYPLIALEKLERNNPTAVNEILVFNGLTLKENKKFQEIMSLFDIKKKTSLEARYPLPNMLSKRYVNLILSHQFYCDLNYLVLEGFYTGFPTVHNSDTCREAGYYYSAFDADQCGEKILEAISSHDDNLDRQKKSSAEMLYRFSIQNDENIKGYVSLIENVS